MATIVFVHGIAQEHLSADSLEASWLPALAGGVRNAETTPWPTNSGLDARPGPMTTRMAYYGDYFLDPGSQGSTHVESLDPQAQELVERLAEAWLRNAVEHGRRSSAPPQPSASEWSPWPG